MHHRHRIGRDLLVALVAFSSHAVGQQHNGRPFHAEYTTARDPATLRVRPFLDRPDNRAACRAFCASLATSDPGRPCACQPGVMPQAQ